MKKDGVTYEMGGVGIKEVGTGDVIKVGPGRLERIVSVQDRNNRQGNWVVETESGGKYSGWRIRAYGRKK